MYDLAQMRRARFVTRETMHIEDGMESDEENGKN